MTTAYPLLQPQLAPPGYVPGVAQMGHALVDNLMSLAGIGAVPCIFAKSGAVTAGIGADGLNDEGFVSAYYGSPPSVGDAPGDRRGSPSRWAWTWAT